MNKYHYSNNNKCECGKLITNNAIRCCHCSKEEHWTRKNYQKQFIGKLAPNYKHGKYIEHNCMDCGKEIQALYNRCKSCSKIFLWKTNLKYVEKQRQRMTGKNNPNYIDGLGKAPYPMIFNNQLKLTIRKRDNFKCQICDIKEINCIKKYKRKLEIHHIDYNKINCDVNNLISLCVSCHMKTNFNRDYWYICCKYILENYIGEIK